MVVVSVVVVGEELRLHPWLGVLSCLEWGGTTVQQCENYNSSLVAISVMMTHMPSPFNKSQCWGILLTPMLL